MKSNSYIFWFLLFAIFIIALHKCTKAKYVTFVKVQLIYAGGWSEIKEYQLETIDSADVSISYNSATKYSPQGYYYIPNNVSNVNFNPNVCTVNILECTSIKK